MHASAYQNLETYWVSFLQPWQLSSIYTISTENMSIIESPMLGHRVWVDISTIVIFCTMRTHAMANFENKHSHSSVVG